MAELSLPVPVPVLFLVADTGGGHRAAARAVAERLRRDYPGSFEPVLLDPLSGPGSAWLLRRIVRLYGPGVRHAPWLWGAAYRATDSRLAMRLLSHTVLRLANRPVRAAVSARSPALVVSCHALATGAAVSAARAAPGRLPVVTVVTDLGAVHASWCHPGADWIIAAPCAAGHRRADAGRGATGPRFAELGVPVAAEFRGGPLPPGPRRSLRRTLGIAGDGFLAVVTGGAEGAGDLPGSVRALVGGFSDIRVVAICGRNGHARRRLSRLARRAAGRLEVRGLVANMADWLRCADVVVTKAGPGTIAEAAACGAPMVITSYLPGQEAGNAELVRSAGAGRYAPRHHDLLREIARLRTDPAALAAMRAAAARLGRPDAAAAIAALIAGLTGAGRPAAGQRAAPAALASGPEPGPERAAAAGAGPGPMLAGVGGPCHGPA